MTSSHSHIYQCSPLRHRLPLQYSTERSSHRQNLHISAGIGGEELKLKAKRFLITLCSSLMYSNCCNISPCTIFESLSFWTDTSSGCGGSSTMHQVTKIKRCMTSRHSSLRQHVYCQFDVHFVVRCSGHCITGPS